MFHTTALQLPYNNYNRHSVATQVPHNCHITAIHPTHGCHVTAVSVPGICSPCAIQLPHEMPFSRQTALPPPPPPPTATDWPRRCTKRGRLPHKKVSITSGSIPRTVFISRDGCAIDQAPAVTGQPPAVCFLSPRGRLCAPRGRLPVPSLESRGGGRWINTRRAPTLSLAAVQRGGRHRRPLFWAHARLHYL